MSPRPSAPLTREDRLIWLRINLPLGKPAPKYMMIDLYCPADRCDAALMLYAQQHKLVTWVGPPMIHVRNSIAAYWADPDVCEGSQP